VRFVPYFVTPEGLAHFASLAREIDAGCVRSISIDQLHIKPQAADMTASLSAGLFRALFNGTRFGRGERARLKFGSGKRGSGCGFFRRNPSLF